MTSYADAGVDLAGAARHVGRIAASVTDTWGPSVVGGFGGFAAGVELPAGYRRPVLMMSTDGVGTKIELARATGNWEGIGQDLVAMCVDDLAASGARPIGFVDYMAVGRLDEVRDAAIVASIASACAEIGVPLLGGETAEHPGVMEAGQVDLAGAAVGIVERGAEITGAAISPGDVVIGLSSPNLRSNGFSLVRKVFEGADLDDMVGDRTLGATLLEPSVLYAPAVLAAIEDGDVHGCAHITGGGIVENLARILPEDCDAVIESTSWTPPPVFALVAEQGAIDRSSMFGTFNMGLGFCIVANPASVERLLEIVARHRPFVAGHIRAGEGDVVLT